MSETVKTVKYRILGEDATTKAFNSAKAGLLGIEKAADKALKIGLTAFTAGSAATAAALVVMTKQGLASVDALAKQSDMLNMSTESLQGFTRQAERSGVGADKFFSNMRRMTSELARAREGTGEAAKSVKMLGLNLEDILRMDTEERMFAIAKAMEGIGDRATKTQIVYGLFGKEGLKMLAILDQGSEAMRKQNQFISEMGMAISNIDAKKVEIANDAFDDVKMTLSGVGQQLAIEVAPMITEVSGLILQQVKDWGGVDTIVKKFVDNSIYGIGAVIDVTQQLGVVWLRVKSWIQDGVLAVADGFADIEKAVRTVVMVSQNLWNGFFHHLKGGWLLMVQSAAGAMESIVGAVNKGLGGAVDVLNELIQKANNIPGIKINEIEFGEGLGAGIKKFADETRAKVDQHFANKPIELTFNDTFDEGPFQRIKKFWSEIKAETNKALGEAENAPPAYKKFLDALEAMRGKAHKAAAEAVSLNKELKDTVPSADEAARALFKLAQEGNAKLTGLAKGAENFANGFARALENMAVQGKFSMKILADFIVAEMVRIAVQQMILRPLFSMMGSALFGAGLTSLGTGFAQAGANLGGLPKASGGSVSAGQSYTVGEGGKREAFVPSQNGKIVPMDKMGGDTYYIDARGADAGQLQKLEQRLVSMERTQVNVIRGVVQNEFNRNPAFGMR